jgi:formamidopyrimidine-DNA glycosylase
MFRRFLNRTAAGQKIEKIDVRDELIRRGVSARKFLALVCGTSFSSVLRDGKYAFATLEPAQNTYSGNTKKGFIGFHFARPDTSALSPSEPAMSKERLATSTSFGPPQPS